ncbi:MAG: LuxR C-terminal-related transcriptional regulator [Sulfuricurvum sp.]|jgi:DNA-binding NarL/FixJ family response regulator
MKFYLISDNVMVKEKWGKGLVSLNPVLLFEFVPESQYNSIIFITDTIISNLSADDITNLFLRRVMVFSIHPDFTEAQKFLQMGAMGYGNAMMHETHLHSAYQALEEGKVWLHPDFITLMISQIRDHNGNKEKSLTALDILSNREREVAVMLGDGASHQEIADGLDITIRTVKAHATAIYQKLDVKDRLALSLLLHS